MNDIAQYLSKLHPFDRVGSHDIEELSLKTDIEYFKNGEVVLSKNQIPSKMYVVIKGIVEERGDSEVVNVHTAGDFFSPISLIENIVKHDFVVVEELIAYSIKREDFLSLFAKSSEFEKYFFEDIASKLSHVLTNRENRSLSTFMTAKVSDTFLRKPIFAKPECTIYDCVSLMEEHSSGVILTNGERGVGVYTDSITRKIILSKADLNTLASEFAVYDLVTIESDDYLFNALLLMLKHKIKRLVVTTHGEIVGVLEQLDLLSFFSSHSYLVSIQIEKATSIDELKAANDNVINLIKALSEKGVKTRYISKLLTQINERLFHKLYGFVFAEKEQCGSLIVMGSEGREEQVLRTDQDNALILSDDCTHEVEGEAQRFSQTLISFGYPKCDGDIMVNNPYWRKSLNDFEAMIKEWIYNPSETNIMNLAIFYDAKCVGGDCEPFVKAKRMLLDFVAEHHEFLPRFAKAALAFDTPIGFFSNLLVNKDKLDLKKGGIFGIVHGIRALSLEYGLEITNTIERIKELNNRGFFDKEFAKNLIESFEYLQSLRLRNLMRLHEAKKPYSNLIDINDLSKLEKDLLIESFKTANKLKKIVSHHFKLDYV